MLQPLAHRESPLMDRLNPDYVGRGGQYFKRQSCQGRMTRVLDRRIDRSKELFTGKGALQLENRLKELREAAGWSQGELARRLGVSRQTINAVETDKYDPSLPLALRMAKLFGCAVPEIFIDRWEPEI
jgi:putative transcriptional regulator